MSEPTKILTSAKRLFLTTVKWTNGLLVALHTFGLVREIGAANYFEAARSFPASVASSESLLLVASLTAFFAAKHRENGLRRLIAKCANITVLCAQTFSIIRFWQAGGLADSRAEAVVSFVCIAMLVPFINALLFWRIPYEVILAEAQTGEQQFSEPEVQGNFLLDHWRGLLSLGVSFWVNGWLVIASILTFHWLLDSGAVIRSAKTAATLYGAIYILAAAMTVWMCVGLWRSATRQIRGGRRPVWGALAKLAVMLFLLNQLGPLVWVYIPKAREHFNYVANLDPVEPYQIQASANGEVIEFSGGLRFGSANALQRALADLPGVKVLKIDSPGGRVAEALKMMGMVHERGLNTYASQRCMSAATLVLTAGNARGAEQGTQIGFHSCRNPSGNSTIGDASVMGSLVSAGIAEGFVHQVLSVPSDQMWFPSPEEMLQAGVLTSYGIFPPDRTGKTITSDVMTEEISGQPSPGANRP